MPTCCVWGCQNSARKGFSMRRFPKDPKRNAIWTSMVNDKNWKPSNSSSLCEVHFDSSSWEKSRCDGKRALKCSAVPSLFLNICDPESSLTDPLNSSSYTPVEVCAVENTIIDSVEKDPLAESSPIQSQLKTIPLLGKISTNPSSFKTMKAEMPKYSTQNKTPIEVYAVENTILNIVEKDPPDESSPIQSQLKMTPLLGKISTNSRRFKTMKVEMPEGESSPIPIQPKMTPIFRKISTNSSSFKTMKVEMPEYSTQNKTPVEVYVVENTIIDGVEKDPLSESSPLPIEPKTTPIFRKISTNSSSFKTMKVEMPEGESSPIPIQPTTPIFRKISTNSSSFKTMKVEKPEYSTQNKTPVEVYVVENTILDSVEKDHLAESSPIQSQPKTTPLLGKISTNSRSFETMKVKMPLVDLLQRKLKRSCVLNKNLSHQLKLLRKENKSLRKRNTVLPEIFNEDQIKALGRNDKNSIKWSNETIQQALELKFCCGTLGYEKLLQLQYPLPSLRTLRRRLEGEMKIQAENDHVD